MFLNIFCAREWDASATDLGELRPRATNHIGCAAVFDGRCDSIADKNFEPLPGEMMPYAKTSSNPLWLTPVTVKHVGNRPSHLEPLPESISSTCASRAMEAQLIYAVDDAPELTELYTILLEETGYTVRSFNDRAQALTALKAERTKPDLLITDWVGSSMSVERFVQCCLVVHPSLRILMVSGYSRADVGFPKAGSDRYIQKPFMIEEFLQQVRSTLAT